MYEWYPRPSFLFFPQGPSIGFQKKIISLFFSVGMKKGVGYMCLVSFLSLYLHILDPCIVFFFHPLLMCVLTAWAWSFDVNLHTLGYTRPGTGVIDVVLIYILYTFFSSMEFDQKELNTFSLFLLYTSEIVHPVNFHTRGIHTYMLMPFPPLLPWAHQPNNGAISGIGNWGHHFVCHSMLYCGIFSQPKLPWGFDAHRSKSYHISTHEPLNVIRSYSTLNQAFDHLKRMCFQLFSNIIQGPRRGIDKK